MKPALTAEEWVVKCSTRKEAYAHSPTMTYDYEIELTEGGNIGIMDDSQYAVIKRGMEHGLAALCLHNQPFGFTREDAELLHVMSQIAPQAAVLMLGHDFTTMAANLASRIESLLPPETS